MTRRRTPRNGSGYLVPEVPGQTHTFFWREIEGPEAAGERIDFLSTIRRLRDAPHEARALGARRRGRVRAHFTSESSAQALVESIDRARDSVDRPLRP